MDPQRLFTRIELKAVSTERREITGYAAAFSNRDRTGDIIDKGAFDRTLKENSDIAVFIGHDTSKLQVGEATSMQADGEGLLTVTSVYDTADGNALLEVAKRRLAKGRTLGMSIGYRIKADKWVGNTRHLQDVDLVEYSFLASPDFAANPLATVVGVKSVRTKTAAEARAQLRKVIAIHQGHMASDAKPSDASQQAEMDGLQAALDALDGVKATGTGPVITTGDSYEDLIDDLEDAAEAALGVYSACVCATFSDHVIVSAMSDMGDGMTYYDFPYTLNADGEPELGEPTTVDPAFVPSEAKARADRHATTSHDPQEGLRMPRETHSVPWDAAFVAALPDDAFAFIEGGGLATKDDTDRTVPRTLRHYPHHNPDGSVDQAHLQHALGHASKSEESWGPIVAAHMERHARAASHGQDFDAHSPEWSEGAPAALLSIGFKVDAIIADIAEDRKSMERLGIDTKKGARLNSSMRSRLQDLHSSLGQILDWADQIEKGDDGKARVDMFRHRLAMLALEEVS